MTRIGCGLLIVLGLFAVPAAHAQSMNIVIGPAGLTPPNTYAAAGTAGFWNGINTANGSTTTNLRDLNGTVTPVSVNQFGGTQVLNFNDAATFGDDETLMDHCLLTFTPNLETCLFINNLQNGRYEVLIYAWMPGQPAVRAFTNSDEEPGNPHLILGGAWPGHHEESVTYARHISDVTTGLLRTHSGIVPGDDPALGAAMNGIQIRKIPPTIRGDMNCDGLINGRDVGPFVQAVIDPDAYQDDYPACTLAAGDMNNDTLVNAADTDNFVVKLLAQ